MYYPAVREISLNVLVSFAISGIRIWPLFREGIWPWQRVAGTLA